MATLMSHRWTAALCIGLAGASFPSARALEPSVNYTLHCMGCHTHDGSAVGDRVPSIRTTLLPFARLPDGRKFLVQVPGSAQSPLSDAELAQLLNWMIENLRSDPETGSFTRFTAREVAAYRRHSLTTVRATRERLLAELSRQ